MSAGFASQAKQPVLPRGQRSILELAAQDSKMAGALAGCGPRTAEVVAPRVNNG